MGREMARLLLAAVTSDAARIARHVILPAELVVRASSGG